MLSNWRVDQNGELRSRRGTTRTATLAAPITSLFRVDQDRYAGAGTSLYKGTTLGTNLFTGTDGTYPTSWASFQGFIWAMNRSAQKKIVGATVYNAGIVAPTGAPTATAASLVTQAIDPMDGSSGGGTGFQNVYSGFGDNLSEGISFALQAGTLTSSGGGFVDLVGVGTNLNATMVNRPIQITDTSGNNYFAVITAVADATHATCTGMSNAVAGATWYLGTVIIGQDLLTPGMNPALLLNPQNAGNYFISAIYGSPKTTAIAGQVHPSDQLQFWFYVGDQTQLNTLTVSMVDSAGVRLNCPISGAGLISGWQQVSIYRNSDGQDLLMRDPQYQALLQQYEAAVAANNGDTAGAPYSLWVQLGALADQLNSTYPQGQGFTGFYTAEDTFDWTSIAQVFFNFSLNGPVQLKFWQLQMAGGTEGVLTGNITYFCTYVNAYGQESNPSPASNDVTVQAQAVNLSALPVSGDAQVTLKKIYRIGGGSTLALFVAQIANATTTFLDDIDFDTVSNTGIQMQTNYDPPPPAKGMLGPFGGKLLAWSSAASLARLWWTLTGKPWAWPGALDTQVGTWEDVGSDGEEIMGVTAHGQSLWIYKRRSVWRIYGNLDAAGTVPQQVSSAHGLMGESGYLSVGQVDYFVGAEGIYQFNGDTFNEVSVPIRPLFRGDWVSIRFGVSWAPINQSAINTCVLGFINGRLYFSYPEGSNTTPSKTLVLDVETGRWAEHDGGFSAFHYEGQGDFLIAGGQSDNGLYEMETGLTDNGSALAVDWQSAFLDQGLPNNPKIYSDVVIEFQSATGGGSAETLTVSLIPESGTVAEIVLGTISAGDRATVVVPITGGLEAKNVAIRIHGSVSHEVIVYGVWIHWYALERKALTFDSGPMDCAPDGQLCDIDQLELTLRSAGTITWTLYTDYNGAMASRATGTIAATGRTSFQIPVSGVRGIQFQLILTSSTEFSLYAARVRLQPLGEIVPFSSTVLPLA